MKSMFKLLLGALLLIAVPAYAVKDVQNGKDVKNGKVTMEPIKNDRFKINEYEFTKAQLYGYLGDLRDDQGLKTVVLKKSKKATPEQLRSISSIARHLQIEAVDEDGNNLIQPQAEPEEPAPPVQPVAAVPVQGG